MKDYFSIFLLCTIGIISIPGISFAQDEVTQILAMAKTQKSFVLTLGENANLKLRSKAYLVARVKKKNGVVYLPVSKIRAIKIYPYESLWVSLKNYYPKALKPKTKFILLTEENFLRGRSELKIKKSDFVSSPKNFKNNLSEAVEDSESHLNKREEDYLEWANAHQPSKVREEMINLYDLNTWEKTGKSQHLKIKNLYKTSSPEDFRMMLKGDTFDKMVYVYLKKMNDPQIVQDLKNERDAQIVAMDIKRTQMSSLEKSQYLASKRTLKAKKAYQEVMSRGEQWSDEYSDEELTEIINQMGEYYERDRRTTLVAKNLQYHAFFHYGTNLLENENLNDRDNTQDQKTDIGASLEYFLFKNFEKMNKITLEGSLRLAQDATSIGEMNAKIYEKTMSLGANWYPYVLPNTIEKNVFYLGLYFRSGFASLIVDSVGEDGQYVAASFPGLKAGSKYNFKNKVSFRLEGSMETVGLERISRSNSDGVLPNRSSYQDGRITFGMGWLF